MSQNKHWAKIRARIPDTKTLLIAYAVVASTAALVMFALFLSAYHTQQRLMTEQNYRAFGRDLLLQFYEKPLANPTEGSVVIPELKIKLPVSTDVNDLLYSARSAVKDPKVTSPERAEFVSKPAILNISSVNGFSCHKLADVTFNEKVERKTFGENLFVADVKLADGRTMYIYQNNSAACGADWGSLTAQKLVDALKHATSYSIN